MATDNTGTGVSQGTVYRCGPGSSVGIATDYGLDGPWTESRWGPDRPWSPASLLYNEYPVFPGVKRPGRGADHPLPPSAVVEALICLL
jgi:hypothetical protein